MYISLFGAKGHLSVDPEKKRYYLCLRVSEYRWMVKSVKVSCARNACSHMVFVALLLSILVIRIFGGNLCMASQISGVINVLS